MADNDRRRRRDKRLAKQKKKRATASRPSRDGGSAGAPPSLKEGRTWPVGECYLSSDWSDPGATVHAVFARSHGDGRTVAAFAQVDRSGPGITALRVIGLPASEAVLSECARISQSDGVGFAGAPAPTVAGLLLDARDHGAGRPAALEKLEQLLDGVAVDDLDTPFGPADAVAAQEGTVSRWLRKILG